eukprot:3802707-Amphidinium_carterae.1
MRSQLEGSFRKHHPNYLGWYPDARLSFRSLPKLRPHQTPNVVHLVRKVTPPVPGSIRIQEAMSSGALVS